LTACFSQDKDELVLEFLADSEAHFLHVIVRSDFSIVRMPASWNRARKNSVDLFPEISGARVLRVHTFQYERCINCELGNGCHLLLKMFGNQSNVLLTKNDAVHSIFRQKLRNDLKVKVSELGRKLTLNKQTLQSAGWNFTSIFPVFGGAIKNHIESQGYNTMDPEAKWGLIQRTLNTVENPEFYLIEKDGLVEFNLFESTSTIFHTKDVVRALNEFYLRFTSASTLINLKRVSLKTLGKHLKNTSNAIAKSNNRLNQLKVGTTYREWADLIMANLHRIKPGVSKVELPDFTTGDLVAIKLKTNLTPQKNAEQYYRKAKNQNKEIDILETNLGALQLKRTELNQHIDFIGGCEDLKSLKKYLKENQLTQAGSKTSKEPLFKEFRYQQFSILVGRNANNNDVLTQKFAHKDDLWLHARDVKGSHVIIRQVPGKPFSRDVIEKAAQIAAFYSKRRTDSLCPVIYTEKKYVRKPKGSAPGQVLVDREQVILVKPENPLTPR